MTSGYRSWEEREAEAAKTRAEAARIAAETKAAEQAVAAGAAKTETSKLAEQVEQAKLNRRLAGIQRDAKADEQQDKAQKREEAADNGTRFKLVTNIVLTLGLLAALPAQLSYFLKLHRKGDTSGDLAWLMAPVPFFLELLAWVGVLGTQWAHRKGLPRWPFWILTAALASVAGYINLTHGATEYGLVAGVALAATSVIGPVLAEVRQALESKAAVDNRSREQRAKEKEAAKKRAAEEREAAKRHKLEDERRKAKWGEVFNEYERIVAAHPIGAITRDEAWKAAWDNLHMLPVGVTVGTLAAREVAREAIDELMAASDRTRESVAVDLFLADVFDPSPGDGGTAGGTRDRGPQGGPRGAGGGSALKLSDRPSGGQNPLGRKGNRAPGRTSAKVPDKPLAEADLTAVRALAQTLGGADKLSVKKIRTEAGVGGADAYLMRLRDVVQAEEK
ncbi:hypothetical protein OIU91_06050 [Streptomyces sp. NBC_01456]|uniref:hypothetical protein n=1 Tax=unclassified Streptomyces TaxID=2593676 RepID=UPI002E379123|nr:MULTISPECIES: hypothetical protein [unclassified Streptomyces]